MINGAVSRYFYTAFGNGITSGVALGSFVMHLEVSLVLHLVVELGQLVPKLAVALQAHPARIQPFVIVEPCNGLHVAVIDIRSVDGSDRSLSGHIER